MNAKTIIKSEQQRIAMQGNRLENYKSMLAYEIEKQSKLEGWDWIQQAYEIIRLKQEVLYIENEILKSQKVIELVKEVGE